MEGPLFCRPFGCSTLRFASCSFELSAPDVFCDFGAFFGHSATRCGASGDTQIPAAIGLLLTVEVLVVGVSSSSLADFGLLSLVALDLLDLVLLAEPFLCFEPASAHA
jgi:hypothetical protein